MNSSFGDLVKRLEALTGGRVEEYLSYRPKESEGRETLMSHIMLTVRYASALSDHIVTLARIVRKIDIALSPENARRVVRYLVLFTAFYHDIGKAEAHYQLYAHGAVDRVGVPHNYASVAFVVENDDIFEGFVEALTGNYGVSVRAAEVMFDSSLTAIALHHEYYDYKDLSFVEVLTPLTIALAKNVDSLTELAFHESVFDLLRSLAEEVGRNLNVRIPVPATRRNFSTTLGRAIEYVATLHYEFGALNVRREGGSIRVSMDEAIASVLELAEALTWVLVLADNLAARHRGSTGEESFFASLIGRYYG
ncbi:hypothetical protein Igag_0917 [Ignisphaera aggregans DSM 17230]|uniref:HD Cas3-type domain-containing protein n=1 Tax=Ignisphaera aggregans (strain DSM 17230 / JCM 13409 / AQ1.S1) TaxID=583356 RepID=E0STW7_IGNAA|nr:hypothetical protein Igag_0917 [Ignisphaera aggregans DSM 17230]